MAKTYFPFASGAGATVTEPQWTDMARLWLATGVISGELQNLEVYADNTGMQIKVRPGIAWMRGHYFKSDAEEVIAIPASSPSNPRLDRVVVRVDWSADTVDFALLQGTPAASPAAPALTQSATRWEISLATVRVETNATSIIASKVTDTRTYANQTGATFNDAEGDPAALGTTAADGTSIYPARRDHRHAADPAVTLVKLAEVVVGVGGAPTVDITGIPATSSHLQLWIQSEGNTENTEQYLRIRFNNSTTGLYRWQGVWGRGPVGSAVVATEGEALGATSAVVGVLTSAVAESGNVTQTVVDIANYKRTNYFKTALGRSGVWFGEPGAHFSFAASWESTAAINRITLFPAAGNFAANSVVTLYGLP